MAADELHAIQSQLDTLHEALMELVNTQRVMLTKLHSTSESDADPRLTNPAVEMIQTRLDALSQRLHKTHKEAQADNRPHHHMTEITVERINVVEPDGTVRMVISNKERAPDGVINGKVLKGREGSNEAGIIFYNNEGDECGSLSYGGSRQANGHYAAGGSLTFDQFKQDEVITFEHEDVDGQLWAGLTVTDRPDMPIDEWAERCMPVFNLPDGTDKNRAIAQLRAEGLLSARRSTMLLPRVTLDGARDVTDVSSAYVNAIAFGSNDAIQIPPTIFSIKDFEGGHQWISGPACSANIPRTG